MFASYLSLRCHNIFGVMVLTRRHAHWWSVSWYFRPFCNLWTCVTWWKGRFTFLHLFLFFTFSLNQRRNLWLDSSLLQSVTMYSKICHYNNKLKACLVVAGSERWSSNGFSTLTALLKWMRTFRPRASFVLRLFDVHFCMLYKPVHIFL